MRAVRVAACLVGLIFGGTVFGFAKNIYVAQSVAGTNSGADCTNAHSAAWFNTAGNWGSGASQVSPGDTVHLCGTFSTALNVQASGTASAITTVLFEPGAQINMPFCPSSGCVGLGNFGFITVDGGSNGLIQSTANGSSLTNQQISYGVFGGHCNDIEVKNLTILNTYVHTQGSDEESLGADNSGGVFIQNAHNNIKIHNNTVSEGHTGIGIWTDTGTFGNWEVYSNTLSQNTWGVDVASGFSSGFLSGASIHDNTIFDNSHWWGPLNNFHTDPIFVRGPNSGNSSSTGGYGNVYIYNNNIFGALGHMTGYVFLSQYSNGPTYVFNNLMHATSTSADGFACAGEGSIAMQWSGTNNYFIYNNTIDGTVCGISASERSTGSFNGTSLGWKNNIGINIDGHYIQSGTYTSDFNDWYLITNAGGQAFATGSSPTFFTYAAWQAAGNDTHSITSNPLINPDYTLQATSPALAVGQNLTSICQGQPVPGLGALCQAKNGVIRPSTGAWDIGAFQHSSQATSVAPPTGLSVIVQ